MPDRNSRAGAAVSLRGLVVASYGRRYGVTVAGLGEFDCVTRGKRSDLACGDRVRITSGSPGQGVIEEVEPRASLLYRSVAHRQKLIAANVTQAVIVVAAEPPPHEELLTRCLAASEHAGIPAAIVVNKSDLPQHAHALATLELYRGLGYPVVSLCALRDVEPLRPILHGGVSVFVGQSGVGKSTLINALCPDARARTRDISSALGAGRHTTTHARLYHLESGASLIDSPGMQAFGLHHLDARALAQAFVEFRDHIGACRFRDCRHLAEPGCAIVAAVAAGRIALRRLELYRRLVRERDSA